MAPKEPLLTMCIVAMFSINPVRLHAERQKLKVNGNMNQSDSAQVKTLDYIASRVKRKIVLEVYS